MTYFERTGNPFPGLRPFDTDEYNLFFGREGQSDELLARLARTRFLAVVGTSGSGKSSLIRAGLLPALYGGLMSGAGSSWRVALLRPGGDPVGALARALNEEVLSRADEDDEGVSAALTETTLRRSSLGLVEAVREARLVWGECVLVVVDQFEELFRFRAAGGERGSEDDAAAFVKLLLEAARQREVPVYVVITMRSDFLGDCAQFRDLPEAINDGQYLIPRMTIDERRLAVTGPAAVGGGAVSPPLVNRLLNDMGDNPDMLPILQHALMRTWEHWSARRRDSEPVSLGDYEAVGGMSDALSRHADEAYDELSVRLRHVAERVFKALTEKGPDNRETRRPTRLADLCAIVEAGEDEVKDVIEVFRREGRSFLMPPAGRPLTPETVIDISHESLIRNWEKLRGWVNEEAESARTFRRLAYATADGNLLNQSSLELAYQWRKWHEPNADWAERYRAQFGIQVSLAEVEEFIDKSQAHRDALARAEADRLAAEEERQRRELEQAQALAEEQERRADAERDRAEEQTRSARRLRWLTAGLAFVVLLALAAAVYAYQQEAKATAALKESRRLAENLDESLKMSQKLAQNLVAEKKKAEAALQQADEERRKAEAAKALAEAKEARAQKEQARAEAAERAAKAEAAKALAAQQKTEEERKRADRQARIIEVSQRANENFREGAAAAERKDYKEAEENLAAAVENFEQILKLEGERPMFAVGSGPPEGGGQQALFKAKVLEGEADAYAQWARLNFDMLRHGHHDVSEILDNGMLCFDKAAGLYGGREVAAPNKAAEALFTLGNLLDEYVKDPSASYGSEVGRGEAVLRKLGLATRTVDEYGSVRYPVDVRSLRRSAAERYRRAFDFYRQASNRDGMMDAALRIANFYAESEDVTDRRLAIRYFEELGKLIPPNTEAARIPVRIGDMYRDLGEDKAAEEFYEKAVREIMRLSSQEESEAYIRVGDEVPPATAFALKFYEKALAAAAAAGDLEEQARGLYQIGVHYRAARDDAKAAQFYRRSFETYKRFYEGGGRDIFRGYHRVANIAADATDLNDERLARDAHDLVVGLKLRDAGARYAEHLKDGAGPWQQASELAHLGDAYNEVEDDENALKNYRRAVEAYGRALRDFKASAEREVTPDRRLGMNYDKLFSIVRYAVGRKDSQLAHEAAGLAVEVVEAKKLLKKGEKSEDDGWEDYSHMSAYIEAGSLYNLLGQPEKAIELSEKGLAVNIGPTLSGFTREEAQDTRNEALELVRKLKRRLWARGGRPPSPKP